MSFLKAIISPSYWFTHQHPVPAQWVSFLLAFFGMLVLIGLISSILSMRTAFLTPVRTLLKKIAAFGWSLGLVGYLLLFFSVQQVAFFSARVLYLVWGIAALIWLYQIVTYAFLSMPKLVQVRKEQLEREKYLPKAGK